MQNAKLGDRFKCKVGHISCKAGSIYEVVDIVGMLVGLSRVDHFSDGVISYIPPKHFDYFERCD